MGFFMASSSHLDHIVSSTSKLEHGLAPSDLDNEDRMNFGAYQRMTEERVFVALRKIPDTDGTEALLQMMRDTTSSYLDPLLEPEERLFRSWRALFFFRIWRAWLIEEGHSLNENFITSNTYACIELNAHALIKAARKLREAGRPELFVPHFFSSQTVEKFFRALRSLTSMSVTKVNFNIRQLLQRVRKIDLQMHIASALAGEYEFPR